MGLMTTSNDSNEAGDATAIAALELLEAARERLHDTLREAAFSFAAAQREEESTRGCFVSYEAVPTLENTLTPLLTVSHAVNDIAEDADPSTGRAGVCLWVLIAKQGERKPVVPSRGAAHKAATTEEGNNHEKSAYTPLLVDPIYYFSEHPSSALRECQAAYRRALQCIVEVACAQHRALAAAEAYASANEGGETKASYDGTQVESNSELG